jgi:ornithine cyclodeaminase
MPTIRILSGQQIREALSMRGAIDAMRTAYGQLSAGQAVMPQRALIESKDGITLFMPAYLAGTGDLAIKIVSVYPDNPSKGQPLIYGLVTALDAATGAPLVVMDGSVLTALRTGAASGLATEILANPDADTVALFGAGVQARTQLEAVCTAREVRSARVYDPVGENVEALVSEMSGKGPIPSDLQAAASPAEAVQGASIIACATSSETPVFDGDDLAPGAHVNGVGSWQPTMQEIGEKTVTRAKVIVDHREAAWEEAGDLIILRDKGIFSDDDIHAELGEIVNGDRPGRESPDEITFFKSVGVGAQDAAVATAILKAAEERSIGTLAEL